MSVTQTEIEGVFSLVREICGNALDHSRSYLIETRLGRILKKYDFKSYQELVQKAKSAGGEPLRREIIDVMTTQETHFFRDQTPFDALRFKLLPELIDAKSKSSTPKRLRIWSAACSHGQEPYSISMILHELIPDVTRWDIKILATDISDAAIAKASRGLYSTMEVDRGLPERLRRFFKPEGGNFQVLDSIRLLVQFRQLNLLQPFPFNEKFDIVLCRNVAIYFTKEDKINLFRRIKGVLANDGHLMVGASESLIDCGPEFLPKNHCGAMVYQPNLFASQPSSANAVPGQHPKPVASQPLSAQPPYSRPQPLRPLSPQPISSQPVSSLGQPSRPVLARPVPAKPVASRPALAPIKPFATTAK